MHAQNIPALDSLMRKYSGTNPGAALKIIQSGKVVLTKTYGMADIETMTPVTEQTDFRLASVTKQFTATCVLLLIDEGKISLNTTLSEVFSNFPAYGKKITIKHLLTHTSGLPDYEDFVADSAFHPQIQDAGVLALLLKTTSGLFEPGEIYQYSNTGYALLALIVEKYSGKTFGQFLKDRIFKPLKMTSSLAYQPGVNEIPNRAFGYSSENGQWKRKDQSSTSAVLGDGGIYTNVEDMAKWDDALFHHTILPAKWQKEAFSYHTLNNGDRINYGYGWHLKESSTDGKINYHTGSTTSFRNIIYRIPKTKMTIILLTNRNKPEEEDMVDVAEKVADIFLQKY